MTNLESYSDAGNLMFGSSRADSIMSGMPSTKTSIWSFRQAPFALKVIILFLVITRVGYSPITKLGLQVGPMPLFLTGSVLLALLVNTVFNQPVTFLTWAAAGARADHRHLGVVYSAARVFLFHLRFHRLEDFCGS